MNAPAAGSKLGPYEVYRAYDPKLKRDVLPDGRCLSIIAAGQGSTSPQTANAAPHIQVVLG
jgi:hypothetical protein